MPGPIITDALQEKEKYALLASIVNSCNNAIISITSKGSVISWNPAAEKLFGYTANEITGKHISLLFPEAPDPGGDSTAAPIIKENEQDQENIKLGKTKGNRLIPLSCFISPVKNDTGTIIGTSIIIRHISEKTNALSQKNYLHNEIKILGSKLDELVAAASHELKTPLTTLKCSLQILKKFIPLDEKGHRVVEGCLHQVDRTTFLVNILQEFSRTITSLQLHPEEFELGGLIKESIGLLKNETGHSFKFGTSNPVLLHADRYHIGQVLISLLKNAVKYSPAGASIEVDITEEMDTATVSVKDHGIGIDKENHDRIFTPFYRAAGSADPGSGMDLYISREIIHRHKGTIHIESEPGRGSLFSFTIPKGND